MTTYQLMKQIVRREAYQLALQGNTYIAEKIKALKGDTRDLQGIQLGYHIPTGANWSYEVQLISYEGELFEVIKRFGEVLHACHVILDNYKKRI